MPTRELGELPGLRRERAPLGHAGDTDATAAPELEHVVDLASGANTRIVRADAANRHWLDLSWSPHGARLAFVSPERGVGTINADGSGQQALPRPAGAVDRAPSWSLDGTRIAYARATADGEAVYTSAVDGSSRRLVTNHGALPSWSPDGKRIALLDGCTLLLYTPSGRDLTRGSSTGCSTWGTPLSACVVARRAQARRHDDERALDARRERDAAPASPRRRVEPVGCPPVLEPARVAS